LTNNNATIKKYRCSVVLSDASPVHGSGSGWELKKKRRASSSYLVNLHILIQIIDIIYSRN
jgi:hypothetical protein